MISSVAASGIRSLLILIPNDPSQFSPIDRLRNVISRRRNRGLRVLEIAVRGADNLVDAEARLAEMLEARLNSVPAS